MLLSNILLSRSTLSFKKVGEGAGEEGSEAKRPGLYFNELSPASRLI